MNLQTQPTGRPNDGHDHPDDPLPPLPSLPPASLAGRALRLILLDELRRRGQSSVAELVPVITAYGPPPEGHRASKLISDGLRWEVRAGRVAKIDRGVYRYRTAPPPRRRRAAVLANAARAWASATPAHPDRQQPPLADLTWLWAR